MKQGPFNHGPRKRPNSFCRYKCRANGAYYSGYMRSLDCAVDYGLDEAFRDLAKNIRDEIKQGSK